MLAFCRPRRPQEGVRRVEIYPKFVVKVDPPSSCLRLESSMHKAYVHSHISMYFYLSL